MKRMIKGYFSFEIMPSDKKNTITKFQSKDGEKWFIITTSNKQIDTWHTCITWEDISSHQT